jgi:hypothetical protein
MAVMAPVKALLVTHRPIIHVRRLRGSIGRATKILAFIEEPPLIERSYDTARYGK